MILDESKADFFDIENELSVIHFALLLVQSVLQCNMFVMQNLVLPLQ